MIPSHRKIFLAWAWICATLRMMHEIKGKEVSASFHQMAEGVRVETLSKGVKQLMAEQPLNGLGVMEFGVKSFRADQLKEQQWTYLTNTQ